jgi:hypothetical protein
MKDILPSYNTMVSEFWLALSVIEALHDFGTKGISHNLSTKKQLINWGRKWLCGIHEGCHSHQVTMYSPFSVVAASLLLDF